MKRPAINREPGLDQAREEDCRAAADFLRLLPIANHVYSVKAGLFVHDQVVTGIVRLTFSILNGHTKYCK